MRKIDYLTWKKLKDFSLDVPEVSFSFSDRLARENGWSNEYAQRAILEYKKFIFLSYISGKSLTPSDEVDQVWHLHMIYTHSYWIEMCKEILGGFQLHHGPTKGGKSEGERFHNQYEETLKLYGEILFEEPPSDIWPSVEQRFSNFDFKRIDMSKNIVINKTKVYEYLASYIVPVVLGLILMLFTFSKEKSGDDDSIWFWWLLGIVGGIFLIRGIYRYVNRNNRGGGGSSYSSSSSSSSSSNGCSIWGSFVGCGSSDSGCSSSSSGCGSSGCGSSGCGGGGCGGCGS
jgi:hypothetical protein